MAEAPSALDAISQIEPGQQITGKPPPHPLANSRAVEALRALTIARNSAIKATTTASNEIKALLVGTDQALRDHLRVKGLLQLATLCSQLAPTTGMHAALASLGRRWLQLHLEIVDLDRLIRELVHRIVPTLIEQPGIGIHSAAQLLITAGGNPHRLHSDAAFAALCGASPIQASSGQPERHRLNRGGDRAANSALWTIANNRMIHDPRTRDFADKRHQQGDSRKDTLRVLKRYIARETFSIIRAECRSPSSALWRRHQRFWWQDVLRG
jgi:transposase